MHIVYSWVLLVLTVACVLAAPARNATIITTTTNTTTNTTRNGTNFSYMNDGVDEIGRSEFDIILTSTTTFIFCIWTSIHPDITPDVPGWYRVLYKLTWMLITIIIPEVTIICAYSQRREATKLKDEWDKKCPERKDAFGMKEAFLVVMGGFTIDGFEAEKQYTQNKAQKQHKRKFKSYMSTLTPKGFRECLAQNYIDENTFGMRAADGSLKEGLISHRALADKGVASIGGKTIATIQVLSFLTQFASRLVFSLKLTLLEVHVSIQVLSAIVAWGCWWEKPLEVNEPIHIPLNQQGQKPSVQTPFSTSSEISPVVSAQTYKSCVIESYSPSNADETKNPNLVNVSSVSNDKSLEIYNTETLIQAGPWGPVTRGDSIETGKKHDWGLFFITRSSLSDPITTIATGSYDITKYIDMSKDSVEGEAMGKVVEVLIIFATGALHASMWNYHFPTSVEDILWKISSIGMATLPIAVSVISVQIGFMNRVIEATTKVQSTSAFFTVVWDFLKMIYKFKTENDESCNTEDGESFTRSIFRKIGRFILTTSCLLFIATYASCILFITVESYISLRSPPDGSFSTVRWSYYWPHV